MTFRDKKERDEKWCKDCTNAVRGYLVKIETKIISQYLLQEPIFGDFKLILLVWFNRVNKLIISQKVHEMIYILNSTFESLHFCVEFLPNVIKYLKVNGVAWNFVFWRLKRICYKTWWLNGHGGLMLQIRRLLISRLTSSVNNRSGVKALFPLTLRHFWK